MNTLNKKISIQSTSYIFLNQWYVRTFLLIHRLFAMTDHFYEKGL